MMDVTATPQDFEEFESIRLRRRSRSPRLVAALATLVVMAGAWASSGSPTATALVDEGRAIAKAAVATTNRYVEIFDPTYSLGPAPTSLADSAPLGSKTFESRFSALATSAPPAPVVAITETSEPAAPTPNTGAMSQPVPAVVAMADDVPLPAPRPSEMREPASPGPVRAPARRMASRTALNVPPPTPPDNRGFIEKLFGIGRLSGPALGYAAAEDGAISPGRSLTLGPPPSYGRSTAVYDIAAHMVYLPNGAQLEAHSGLGDRLDDPRHVNERMRGATPPQTYDLTLREQLFHGVQALRLNPVGGGGVFGRTGLLAHTYMLGPNGDSNGCISFRDYDRFLQAYMNGDVKRLVVIARQN